MLLLYQAIQQALQISIYELKEGALNIVKKADTTEINNLE